MEYKGVRYELLEVVNPFGWKWIVQLGATKTAGFSRSKYVADFAGLGLLVDGNHIRKTLASIYKYNYKRSLYQHNSVQRTFALNDEAALVICDHALRQRGQTGMIG